MFSASFFVPALAKPGIGTNSLQQFVGAGQSVRLYFCKGYKRTNLLTMQASTLRREQLEILQGELTLRHINNLPLQQLWISMARQIGSVSKLKGGNRIGTGSVLLTVTVLQGVI